MVAFILPANSATGGYEISNSLRFNDGDSPSLQFTPSSAGNEKTWTVSFWVKRGVMGTSSSQMIFASDTNYDEYVFCRFCGTEVSNKTDMFQVFMVEPNGREGNVRTARLFRDPSAWYHIVVRCDLTQGTAADRLRIYVNGVKETSFDTASYLNQNDDNVNWNSNVPQAIGHQKQASSVERHLDGHLSEFYNIDGTSLGPDSFGETNDNGVWVPKKYSGSYGTNGYFLEFQQTGTSANSSGMGADTSGNDHHWTPANLAATDVTTDTPTNNFATLNPLANYFNPATLSEGNTRVDFADDASTNYVISNIGVSSGKWYCEVKGVDIPNYGEIGIASRPRQNSGNNDKMTVNVNNYGYTANNGKVKNNNTAGSSYGDSYTDGDMIGIAMDLDNNKLYFSKNGTFQNSGDPTTGSTGTGAFSIAAASTTHDGVYYFAGGSNKNNDDTRMDFNFGNPPFAISSGNSDADGHGNFEYAVPSGYFALCTKNLAEYG